MSLMKHHFIIEEVKTMVFLTYLDWEVKSDAILAQFLSGQKWRL